ncbi:UNVERIFIED_CONTAM: hypothetical protein FKN15_078475 [Acipenser sinensis]
MGSSQCGELMGSTYGKLSVWGAHGQHVWEALSVGISRAAHMGSSQCGELSVLPGALFLLWGTCLVWKNSSFVESMHGQHVL